MSHPNSSWLHWVACRLVVVTRVNEPLTGSIVVIAYIGIEEIALAISIEISSEIQSGQASEVSREEGLTTRFLSSPIIGSILADELFGVAKLEPAILDSLLDPPGAT